MDRNAPARGGPRGTERREAGGAALGPDAGALRFTLDRLTEFSDAAILDEIRRVSDVVAEPVLSIARFERHARVAAWTARRRFGSWRAALERAGVGHRYSGAPAGALLGRPRARGITRARIVIELNRVARAIGRDTVRVADLGRAGRIGADAVRARFGSWRQALLAAGLRPAPRGNRWSDQERWEHLARVWTRLGRPPLAREMRPPLSAMGAGAYLKRFGGWRRTLAAFVRAYAAAPAAIDAHLDRAGASGAGPRRDAAARRAPGVALRFAVMHRDRFRCTACGASPATELDCRLEIDHVVPWSKGGRSDPDNLRTLCRTCNQGRGNRF